ncbi:hypothetical protein B9Z55_007296 [Caenorhabditis nigoni]|uniref:Uncharacterized protein n=1 Tax=Caenorhabditis nigoni TaxID=1611254 RepID=A0A2G5V8Y6_9PELO|nr:hypothetical protein B9Z55_007296 [Caenorhabditis nigoni]
MDLRHEQVAQQENGRIEGRIPEEAAEVATLKETVLQLEEDNKTQRFELAVARNHLMQWENSYYALYNLLERTTQEAQQEVLNLERRLAEMYKLENARLHGIIVQQLFRINHLEELLEQARGGFIA